MRKFAFFVLLLFFSGGLLFLQIQNEDTFLELAYTDELTALTILDKGNNEITPFIHMKITPPVTILTGNTSAEFRFIPNSSIIRIAPKSTFVLDSLEGYEEEKLNSMRMAQGKLRMVAAKTTSLSSYRIKTPSAVAGIRGTDFIVYVEQDIEDSIYVQEGVVEFAKDLFEPQEDGHLLTGDSVLLNSGQYANAMEKDFVAQFYDMAIFNSLFNELEFLNLSPNDVRMDTDSISEDTVLEETTEEIQEESIDSSIKESIEEKTILSEELEKKEKSRAQTGFSLAQLLSLDIGSITISGVTYAKAVIQPSFSFGKIKLALFLPIIYTSDIFNPSDWYKPAGNNEWSFGFDQEKPADKVKDLFQDIALKIKYLEIGDKDTDTAFLKLGNLDNLSLGHGSLIRNFSNNYEFPAIRKLGLNFGLDFASSSLETVFDDVADMRVAGIRWALGSKSFLAFGASAAIDINPSFDYNRNREENPYADYGEPVLVGTAVDVQLFHINFKAFSLKSFVDTGFIFPIFRREPIVLSHQNTIPSGLTEKNLLQYAQHNYFAMAGIHGKILSTLKYGLEYRVEKGLAEVALFNTNWNRNRIQYIDTWHAYLAGDTKEQVESKLGMGLYGFLESNFFRIITISGAYYLPWALTENKPRMQRNDSLDFRITVPKGKIPFIPVFGSLYYSRKDFAYAVQMQLNPKNDEKISLFDENTVFGGECVFGISEGLELALHIFSSAVYSDEGELIYKDSKPLIRPVISLETRIAF